MCATGVLNVNAFGFPTLLLKSAVFLLAALWLLLNRVDNRGYDYPLVRVKYGLLLVIAPLTVAEGAGADRLFPGAGTGGDHLLLRFAVQRRQPRGWRRNWPACRRGRRWCCFTGWAG
ncbi:MAG: hypothetical protein M0C28_06800 [Candidatus Moduliflexus flocculans]|nr:hypothetical protein [Candidatus Moduliflexus flocculans]